MLKICFLVSSVVYTGDGVQYIKDFFFPFGYDFKYCKLKLIGETEQKPH